MDFKIILNYVKLILESPIFKLLFGSGGILIIILTVLTFFNKRSGKHEKEDRPFDAKNKDYESSYGRHKFKSEEFYLQFLKTLEEKKKKGDKIDYDE